MKRYRIGGLSIVLEYQEGMHIPQDPPYVAMFEENNCNEPICKCYVLTYSSYYKEPNGKEVFRGKNELVVEKEENVISFHYPEDEDSFIRVLVVDLLNDSYKIYVDKHRMTLTAQSIIESTPFQIMYMMLLSLHDGVLLHTSAIVSRNNGLAFCGPSGNGKTTITRLFALNHKIGVLTDETAVIRIQDGKVFIYGSPWKSMKSNYAKKDYASLNTIFLIKHGKSNALLEMSSFDKIRALIKQTFPFFWDREKTTNNIQILKRIIDLVSVVEYSFLPDNSATQFILNNTTLHYGSGCEDNVCKFLCWFKIIKRELAFNCNRHVKIRVHGQSMIPTLKPNQTVSVVYKEELAIKEDDMIVYKHHMANLTIHRVVKIISFDNLTYLVTKGDNNCQIDDYLVTFNEILGVVVQ